MRKLWIVASLGGLGLWAQSSDTKAAVSALVKAGAGNARDEAVSTVWNSLVDELMSGGASQFLARRRADIRNGASSGAAGSTSTVLNPLLPAAFGFAFENGSAVRTVSGNTTTISVNPAGLICATRVGASAIGLREEGCQDYLRRWGISLTFDTSRGKNPTATSTLKALSDQFAEAAIRYEVVNQRKPGSARFKQALHDWTDKAKPAANSMNRLDIKLRPFHAELESKLKAKLDSFQGTNKSDDQKTAELLDVVREVKGKIPVADPDVSSVLTEAAANWRDLLKADDRAYNTFAHGWVATAEYSLERPDIATDAVGASVPQGTRPPSLHTARFVVSRGLMNYNLDFTLNFSSSWFDQKRPGMTSLWRDAQVAGDAKWRLRDIPDFGTPILSMAGLYMHLNQRPLGFAIPEFSGTKINEPGNIGVFQAKLELPTANAAVRIPISFTYANRTDLIKESDVRGQIGISLNLDSVFANPSK
ncbi:MAG TPA: hypothetical protein VEV17_25520 [Bryobacteraceae bacterium]|nr:hypothetical protein [Bryobacteraceae bacterium]